MTKQIEQLHRLIDKTPTEKHANNKGECLFYVLYDHPVGEKKGSFFSCHWNHIPTGATHWSMCFDVPPDEELGIKQTREQILEQKFKDAFTGLFPNPIIERGLMEPIARKLFDAGLAA
tara:strand:+ start:330 stop:683 length:354 start_codon:yes stop_codon:yes gene_type:complete